MLRPASHRDVTPRSAHDSKLIHRRSNRSFPSTLARAVFASTLARVALASALGNAALASTLASTLAVALLASGASAVQLKLPNRPREEATPRGNIAPFRVCSVCGGRNYTHIPMGRKDEAGRELVWCDTCKRDTAQAYSTATDGSSGIPESAPKGQLKLPRTVRPQPAPAGPPPPVVLSTPEHTGDEPLPPIGPIVPLSPLVPGAPSKNTAAAAATFVFTEVSRLPSSESGTAQRAVESLAAMGPEGLAAARTALFEDRTVTIVVAARVLLRGGELTDADLVVRRLRSRLPTGAGAALLRVIVEGDPVRATPELFASLLDHSQATLRNAASRELRPHMQESTLPLIEPALVSTRAETRALALELAASVSGTRATADILSRLEDPSARVAAAAVTALRVRDDVGLDNELLRRAFNQRWILRPNAYALLAILEREDAELRPILQDEHIQALLAGLESSDPFLAGTCAASLAGLGFRSPRPDVSQWLDGPVVDRLVVAVSGQAFHDDHSSLSGPAVRRLRLLSGETFGPDGPAWVDWWVRTRVGFHARRAALAILPGEEGKIRIVAIAPELDLDVELLGPDVAPTGLGAGPRREAIRLTAAQAEELGVALVREGVLSAEHMPGAYQSEGREDRLLEIDVNGRPKTFVVGPRAKAPWFEHLLSLAVAVRARDLWQVLIAPPTTVADRGAWDAEAAWWVAEHTDAEREARLAVLALAALRSEPSLTDAAGSRFSALQRERALDALERAQAAGALPAETFVALLPVLRQERTLGDRTRRMLALTIQAGRNGEAPLDAATAQQLIDAIETDFGIAGTSDLLALVLHASDRDFVRRLAADPGVERRRAATIVLGDAPDDEDARALLTLLNDPDARVHTAAAEALGTAQVEMARDDLLSRARLSSGSMRRAALRAAGALGGPHVLDALVLGLADPDVDVRRAAVEGLGFLRDPAAAQVLVTMLNETGDAPLGAVVRTALVRIGEPAVPALRRVAEAGDGKSRRQAALVLAELVSPDAAPALLAIVSADRADRHAANELAMLTCFDPRVTADDPVNAWWTWWEGVRHDDALVWFRAGVERLGIAQPPEGALEGAGTIEGQRFLLTLLDREEAWLSERAWRELARLTGEPLGDMPPRGSQRSLWVRERRAALASAPGTPR